MNIEIGDLIIVKLVSVFCDLIMKIIDVGIYIISVCFSVLFIFLIYNI